MITRPILSSALTLASAEAARQLASAWDGRRSTPSPEAYAGGWFVITQPDHAALSGQFARHWGNELFAPVQQEAMTAIAHHDDGWLERDTVPRYHPPTRGPQNFLDLEPENFAAISRRSIELARARSALSGYMVSWHFLKLAEARSAVDARFAAFGLVRDFIAEQRARQVEWRSQLASLGDEAVDEACQLLQFTDMLSICICLGALDDTTFPQNFRTRNGMREKISLDCEPDSIVVLSPSPFDRSPLNLRVSGRRLSQATFAGQEELAQVYNQATEEMLSFEIRAGA